MGSIKFANLSEERKEEIVDKRIDKFFKLHKNRKLEEFNQYKDIIENYKTYIVKEVLQRITRKVRSRNFFSETAAGSFAATAKLILQKYNRESKFFSAYFCGYEEREIFYRRNSLSCESSGGGNYTKSY